MSLPSPSVLRVRANASACSPLSTWVPLLSLSLLSLSFTASFRQIGTPSSASTTPMKPRKSTTTKWSTRTSVMLSTALIVHAGPPSGERLVELALRHAAALAGRTGHPGVARDAQRERTAPVAGDVQQDRGVAVTAAARRLGRVAEPAALTGAGVRAHDEDVDRVVLLLRLRSRLGGAVGAEVGGHVEGADVAGEVGDRSPADGAGGGGHEGQDRDDRGRASQDPAVAAARAGTRIAHLVILTVASGVSPG